MVFIVGPPPQCPSPPPPNGFSEDEGEDEDGSGLGAESISTTSATHLPGPTVSLAGSVVVLSQGDEQLQVDISPIEQTTLVFPNDATFVGVENPALGITQKQENSVSLPPSQGNMEIDSIAEQPLDAPELVPEITAITQSAFADDEATAVPDLLDNEGLLVNDESQEETLHDEVEGSSAILLVGDQAERDTGTFSQDTLGQLKTQFVLLPKREQEVVDLPPLSPRSITAALNPDIMAVQDSPQGIALSEAANGADTSSARRGDGEAEEEEEELVLEVTVDSSESSGDEPSPPSRRKKGKEKGKEQCEQDQNTVIVTYDHTTPTPRRNRQKESSNTKSNLRKSHFATSSWFTPGPSLTTRNNRNAGKKLADAGVSTQDLATVALPKTRGKDRTLKDRRRSQKSARKKDQSEGTEGETIVHVVAVDVVPLPTAESKLGQEDPETSRSPESTLSPARTLKTEGFTRHSTENEPRDEEVKVNVRGGNGGRHQKHTVKPSTSRHASTNARARQAGSVRSRNKRRAKKSIFIEQTTRISSVPTPKISWGFFSKFQRASNRSATLSTSKANAKAETKSNTKAKARVKTTSEHRTKRASTITRTTLSDETPAVQETRQSTKEEWFDAWIGEQQREVEQSTEYNAHGERVEPDSDTTLSQGDREGIHRTRPKSKSKLEKHRHRRGETRGEPRRRDEPLDSVMPRTKRASTHPTRASQPIEQTPRRLTEPTTQTAGSKIGSKFSGILRKILLIPLSG